MFGELPGFEELDKVREKLQQAYDKIERLETQLEMYRKIIRKVETAVTEHSQEDDSF